MTTVDLPDVVAERLAAAAPRRGMTATELATEVLSEHLREPGDGGALDRFIGSLDSGDPEWASTPTSELRGAAAKRRSA